MIYIFLASMVTNPRLCVGFSLFSMEKPRIPGDSLQKTTHTFRFVAAEGINQNKPRSLQILYDLRTNEWSPEL